MSKEEESWSHYKKGSFVLCMVNEETVIGEWKTSYRKKTCKKLV